MTIAETLSRYVVELAWRDLPGSIVAAAKARILDFAGVALAARGDPAATAVLSHVTSRQEEGPCSILGERTRTSAPLAALANGVLGHCLELDDEHHVSLAHIGVVVVPACLAAAEMADRSGREVLEAVVAGYEVTARIGRAPGPGVLHDRGFHPTGVVGTFGAAAAAAKLLGLGWHTTVSALGIAGSMASSVFEFVADGSLTKRLHPGWAAHSGLVAAQLAAAGLTGPASIFEGRHGFFHAFAGEGRYDSERSLEGLGESFEIARVAYKPYACCSYIHPAIDAALAVLREHELATDEIEVLDLYVHPATLHIIAEPEARKRRPQTVPDAQFSVYHAVAAALLAPAGARMRTYREWFQDERLHDPRVRALADRIRCAGDPAFDRDFPVRYPARAEVATTRGERFCRAVRTHRGDPADVNTTFSLADIEARFREVTAPVLTPDCQTGIIALVGELDSLRPVRGVAAAIGGAAAGAGASREP